MEELYDEIEQYLDNEMTDAARTDFEARLATDAALKQQFNALKNVRETLGRHFQHEKSEQELTETLSALGKQHFGQKKPEMQSEILKKPTIERKIGPRVWALAAVLVTVLAAVYFIFLQPKQDLYASYREFPKANFTVRGNSAEEAMAAAEKAFNAGDYAAALPHFKTYLQEQPEDSEARFFYALALMENGETGEAQTLLSELSQQKNLWASEAAWFLILNDLKKGDKASAKARLEKLNGDNVHFGEARKLLEELKK